MTDAIGLWSVAFFAGAGLGMVHLGLLWIGARGLAGPRPALVFVSMAALRAGLILGAVAAWVVWGGAWASLLWALAGFVMLRGAATRWAGRQNGEVR